MRLQPWADRVDRSMRLGRLAVARHDIRGRAEGHGHRGRGLRHAAGEVLRALLADVGEALALLGLARVLLPVPYDDDVRLIVHGCRERPVGGGRGEQVGRGVGTHAPRRARGPSHHAEHQASHRQERARRPAHAPGMERWRRRRQYERVLCGGLFHPHPAQGRGGRHAVQGCGGLTRPSGGRIPRRQLRPCLRAGG